MFGRNLYDFFMLASSFLSDHPALKFRWGGHLNFDGGKLTFDWGTRPRTIQVLIVTTFVHREKMQNSALFQFYNHYETSFEYNSVFTRCQKHLRLLRITKNSQIRELLAIKL